VSKAAGARSPLPAESRGQNLQLILDISVKFIAMSYFAPRFTSINLGFFRSLKIRPLAERSRVFGSRRVTVGQAAPGMQLNSSA
jgi:hypothetical protein